MAIPSISAIFFCAAPAADDGSSDGRQFYVVNVHGSCDGTGVEGVGTQRRDMHIDVTDIVINSSIRACPVGFI